MTFSRRTFSKAMLSALAPLDALTWLGKPRAFAAPSSARPLAPPLGLNTWSLRALKHDQAIPAILRVMKETGLRDCQLLFSHAEPEEFDPQFGSIGKPATPQQRDEQTRRSEARTAWRLSVPMTYFEALRAQFVQQGLTIRAYAAQLGGTAEELDRIFLMATKLGCSAVTGGVSEAQTDLVAAAAERHQLLVGMQVRDLKLIAQQLRASSRLRANPDIGDLTKAGVPALEFVKEHLQSIYSIDLKDAVAGGPSVPFGTGQAHMQQVLEFLTRTPGNAELYIDCDYPGTGSSTDEVKRSLAYVRGVLDGQRPGAGRG